MISHRNHTDATTQNCKQWTRISHDRAINQSTDRYKSNHFQAKISKTDRM